MVLTLTKPHDSLFYFGLYFCRQSIFLLKYDLPNRDLLNHDLLIFLSEQPLSSDFLLNKNAKN